MAAACIKLSVPDEPALAEAISFYAAQFDVIERGADGAVLHRRKRRWLSATNWHLLLSTFFQTPPDTASLSQQMVADRLREVDPDVQEIELTIAR